jgi:hypothetical protein
VLAGRVPTESGLGAYRPVEAIDAASGLRTIIAAAGVPVIVHCCAPGVPLQVVRDAGAAAVAIDLALLKDLDPLGEAIEADLGLFAGAAPTAVPPGGRAVDGKQVAERLRTLWSRLGFSAERLARQVVVTPACGLADGSEQHARAVLTACREAGRRLAES